MISCAECLSAVLVADRDDMDAASAVGLHCATCADCTRVVTQVLERERNVSSTLGDVRMSVLPSVIAQQAIAGNRRVIAHFWRIGLMAALITVASVGIVNNLVPFLRRTGALMPREPVVTESIPLKCITPEQAVSLATPYIRSAGAVYSTPGIPAVTVRAKRNEFKSAWTAIQEFDVACQLPKATTVEQPAPISPSTPKKD